MMPSLAAAGTVFGCWINGGRITMAMAERWNISYGALILGSKGIMTVSEVYISDSPADLGYIAGYYEPVEVYISSHATAHLACVTLQAIDRGGGV